MLLGELVPSEAPWCVMARCQMTFSSLLVLAGLLVGVHGQDCNTTFPDETACTPGPPHSMADSKDCTMFYLCYKGCVTHETCEHDWLFDDEINYCNLQGLVDCGERPCTDETHCPQPSTTTTTATTSTTTTTITTSTTVPTTTTFTTITTTTTTSTVPTTTTFAPTTTTTMTTTTPTRTTTTTTPTPTTTNPIGTTTTPIATTSTTTTTINTTTPPCDNMLPSGRNCPHNGEHGPFADSTDCTVFWMCEEGCAIKLQCAKGFLFNMDANECQKSLMVDCGPRPCGSWEHCPCVDHLPSPQNVKCSATSGPEVDFYPDLEDCTSFFNCTQGCFTHQKCQFDYLYLVEKQWCDYNDKIDCEARPCLDPDRCDGQSPPMTTTPITTTTSAPTTTTTITTTTASPTTTTISKCKTPCEESDFIGKIADSSNCRKYWHCMDNGEEAHVRCPADWLYDSDSKECGQDVECGDRPVCDDCGENCQHQHV